MHAAKSVCFISQSRWVGFVLSLCSRRGARHASPAAPATKPTPACLSGSDIHLAWPRPRCRRRCAALVRVLRQSRGAPLLSMAVAEAAAAVVCEPGSRTTDQATLDAVLQARHLVGWALCWWGQWGKQVSGHGLVGQQMVVRWTGGLQLEWPAHAPGLGPALPRPAPAGDGCAWPPAVHPVFAPRAACGPRRRPAHACGGGGRRRGSAAHAGGCVDGWVWVLLRRCGRGWAGSAAGVRAAFAWGGQRGQLHQRLPEAWPYLTCPPAAVRCHLSSLCHAEGAILQHLLSALSGRPGGHSGLSRDLVALWADEYAPALALLKRFFPPGLIRYLNQRRQPPAAAGSAAPQAAAAAAAPAPQPAAGQQQAQQAQGAEGQAGGASALAATQQLVAAASVAPAADPLQQGQDGAATAQQQQQAAQRAADSPVDQRFISPPPQRPGKRRPRRLHAPASGCRC